MANKKNNFSKEKYLKQTGAYENTDSPLSHGPVNEENIDLEAWAEFISYYRYYIDEFACDILGLKLYPFQRIILRGMARYQNSMFIACRGRFSLPHYTEMYRIK